MDIGSGGGLPAIPLAIAHPILRSDLVERSEVKCQFLRQVSRSLGLSEVTVHQESFPDLRLREGPRAIVARAVENADVVDKNILERLGRADLYLAQREMSTSDLASFTVVRVRDSFSSAGLRRGELLRICR